MIPTELEVVYFWARVYSPDLGCWPWLKCTDEDGYGQLRFRGKVHRAHRLAYLLSTGPISVGLHALHTCDNPPCCRPSHLYAGTQAQNVRDSWERGRRLPRFAAVQT